jgi:hypothetical protein
MAMTAASVLTTQGGNFFQSLRQRQSLDLATKRNLAVSRETDNVEDLLANIDADRAKDLSGNKVVNHSLGRLRTGAIV